MTFPKPFDKIQNNAEHLAEEWWDDVTYEEDDEIPINPYIDEEPYEYEEDKPDDDRD